MSNIDFIKTKRKEKKLKAREKWIATLKKKKKIKIREKWIDNKSIKCRTKSKIEIKKMKKKMLKKISRLFF